MKEGLIFTGTVSMSELKESQGYPSEARFQKGPVAVIECIQEIPCNPCETACRFGAIQIGKPITNVPKILEDKCIGCGGCIASCPGLAIFLEDHTFSETEALVAVPYEYPNKPGESDRVKALDRSGKHVVDAIVYKIIETQENDKTTVIYLKVPKKYAHQVRGIKI